VIFSSKEKEREGEKKEKRIMHRCTDYRSIDRMFKSRIFQGDLSPVPIPGGLQQSST